MGLYANFETAIMQSVMAAVASAQPVVSPDVANFPAIARNLSGFAGQARVATAFGDVPIEALRVGDYVRTFSGKMVCVRKIDQVNLDDDGMRTCPSVQPIRISANAFGPGRPVQEILVLPEQEIGPDAHVATRFKTATELCPQARAHRVKTSGHTYYQIHCDEAVTVRVEGVWVRVGH